MTMPQAVLGSRSVALQSRRQSQTCVLPSQFVQRRRFAVVRAESESNNAATTEAEVPQKPKQKSAWELIEEPVRSDSSKPLDGGRPVSARNNQFDDLLINYDGADERAITGLPISWPDAFRFKSAVPEVVNCRLAMIACLTGFAAELGSGKSILEQFKIAPLPIAGVFLLFIVASLVPISKGIPRSGGAKWGGLAAFTPDAEIIIGRTAMLGIAGTILTELVIGKAVL